MSVLETVTRFRSFLLLAAAVLGLVLLLPLAGCDTDTEVQTIFVEPPFFEEPPAEAQGFLGYDEQANKLVVCGNCHVGQQAAWQGTKHADAWATLQGSGHAQAFCENCHTAGPLGNPTTGDVGWAGSKDERYHDVQCESCHGPGQTHISNPDASQPLASMALGDVTNLEVATSCAECHQGTHHPFVEEWAQSRHAVVGFQADRPECAGCHRGQGILTAWGVKDDYVEKNSAEHLAIVCGVCHDPHDARNEGQLRFPVKTASIEEHLCARCHDRRTVPDPNSSHGLEPHAPQAALLLGDAGWFPPNAQINQGQIVASHGSEGNEKLCATCHVNAFEVTDAATGAFVFNATGHLFTAIPCLDDRGVPTTGDCGLTTAARSFDGCTAAGCHGTQDAAAAAITVAATRIQRWADELHAALEAVDPGLEEAGGEIDATDPTFTVAEGALFNYHLATFGGSANGSTAHNPFLTEALLIASLQAVEDTYGVRPPTVHPSVNWDEELQKVLDRAPAPGSITPIRRSAL